MIRAFRVFLAKRNHGEREMKKIISIPFLED
jgi:hypothetical protein